MNLRMTAVLIGILLGLSACRGSDMGDGVTAQSALPDASQRGERESAAPAENEPEPEPSTNEPVPDSLPEQSVSLAEQEEPAVRETYEPAEWNDWQEDPTLHDDMFTTWDRVEYRIFGDPQDYVRHRAKVGLFDRGGNILEQNVAEIEYSLPPLATGHPVLYAELGFLHGSMKFGEIGSSLYLLEEDEDPYAVESGNFDRSRLTAGWGEPLHEIQTRDNVLGGVCEGPNYIRGVGMMPNGHQIMYYVRPDEDHLLYLYFYVSEKATAEDLALYDAIAESVRVVTETD